MRPITALSVMIPEFELEVVEIGRMGCVFAAEISFVLGVDEWLRMGVDMSGRDWGLYSIMYCCFDEMPPRFE